MINWIGKLAFLIRFCHSSGGVIDVNINGDNLSYDSKLITYYQSVELLFWLFYSLLWKSINGKVAIQSKMNTSSLHLFGFLTSSVRTVRSKYEESHLLCPAVLIFFFNSTDE
uniref:Uncharacterized protein n=1 Tax=Onchocerca volvulus TaxID=6282 RepID=A0A8R1TTE9_ONCVO